MEKTNIFGLFLASILISFVLINISSIHVIAQDENDTNYEIVDEEDQNLIDAQLAEKESINQAFSWLALQVKDKWPDSTEENSLALLALSYDDLLKSKGKTALLNKKTSKGCWVEGATGVCDLKSTAIAINALSKFGENTKAAESWLLGRKVKYTATNLLWHLQIDSDVETNCTISYDNEQYKVHLNEKPRQTVDILSAPSSGDRCIIPSSSKIMQNYWLQIKNTLSCLNKTYSVKCSDEAVARVSMPYQKNNILFIPSETSTTPTKVEIKTECLADEGTSTCNYEGTLWATYILNKKRYSISVNTLLPYLVSQSEDVENAKFLPDSLLYLITGQDEYAENLISSENHNEAGFWYSVRYGKFYSTALATFALRDYYAGEDAVNNAKEYLLSKQDVNGYWNDGNSIKDTSFVLYVLWYGKGEIPEMPDENATINGCADAGYSCKTECNADEKKETYLSKDCAAGEICCRPKETSPDCTSIIDCLNSECEGKEVENCTCEYEKESYCDDECDNDNNGLTDMEDPSCQKSECELNNYACCHECADDLGHIAEYDTGCSEGAICCDECKIVDVEICDNKIDDDGDNLIDCKDPECKNNVKCKKSLLWLWILLPILIIAGIIAGLYFYYKSQDKDFFEIMKNKINRIIGKKEEVKEFKFMPGKGNVRQQIPQAQQRNIPAQQQARQMPMQPQRMPQRPVQKAIKKPEKKSETEEELEKTLKKLEEMGE